MCYSLPGIILFHFFKKYLVVKKENITHLSISKVMKTGVTGNLALEYKMKQGKG